MKENIIVRGIYGGVPRTLLENGGTLTDYGINAVWIGSGALTQEDVALLREQKVRVFAEFNTMHYAPFLERYPDAAPAGPDGATSPPPDGWQGICPTHPVYRQERMDAFRAVLTDFAIDGIWLDYHHSHASWEQAIPNLPDTCFCPRCLDRFQEETGVSLPAAPIAERSALLLGAERDTWTRWRCAVFTDWVREFAAIRDAVRPTALLGTFHCPWTDTENDNALREKLAIDLKAQSAFIDVFSIMPYHARFGHQDDVEWITRQVTWLATFLAEESGRKRMIWPIVQLSDWGEKVPVDQVPIVMEAATRPPATGVTVFNWGSLQHDRAKIDALCDFYRAIAS